MARGPMSVRPPANCHLCDARACALCQVMEKPIHRASPLAYAIAFPATTKAAKVNRDHVIRTVLGIAGIKVQ